MSIELALGERETPSLAKPEKRKRPRQRARRCARSRFCAASGVRFQTCSGRWGREKADVGAVESETEHRRVRQRGKEPLQRRNGVALASRDSSVFPDATRSRHAREFPSPFLSLSLASSSLSPSPPLSLSLPSRTRSSRSLFATSRPFLSIFLVTSFLVLSLRAHLQDDVEARRALPPLAGHGAGPIGAPLPATTTLQSAHGADG